MFCYSCKSTPETGYHIFYERPNACDIRNLLGITCYNNDRIVADQVMLHKWNTTLKKEGPDKLWTDIILAWTLWWNRNQKAFCGIALSDAVIINHFYESQHLINSKTLSSNKHKD